MAVVLLRLAPLLFLPRAVEGAEGEVEEGERDGRVDEKARVIVTGVPLMAQLVGILAEEEPEESKEEAGDFEPEDAAGVSEGSPDGLAESFGASGNGASPSGPLLSIGGSLPLDGRSLLLHRMSGLRGTVTDHAGRDTNTYAEFATKTVRLHTQKCSSGRAIHIASAKHRK